MSDPRLTEVGWTGTALRVAGRLEPDGAAPESGLELELELRERGGDGLFRVPAATRDEDGGVAFEALVDVAAAENGRPLPGGLWDVVLRDLTRGAGSPPDAPVLPLGRSRTPGLDTSPQRRFLPDGTTVAVYITPRGELAVDVGGRTHAAGSVRADRLSWDARTDQVLLTGRLALAGFTTPISATLNLRDRRRGRAFEVICMLEAVGGPETDRPEGLYYTAALPVTRAFIDQPLPRGVWEASLRLGFSGMHRELRVLAPPEPLDMRVRRRFPLRMRIASTAAPEPLAITVGRG